MPNAENSSSDILDCPRATLIHKAGKSHLVPAGSSFIMHKLYSFYLCYIMTVEPTS